MARHSSKLFLGGVLLALAACASEPEPVTVTPTFDKFGDPVCPVGTVVATDAASGATVCVDPATL